MDSVRHLPQHERYKHLPLMQPQRLLHIEASGSEVVIHHEPVVHIGHFSGLTQLRDGDAILEKVAVFKGHIIPVIDIRDAKLKCAEPLKDVAYHDVLVISLHGQLVGVRVEKVIEMLMVPARQIEPLRTSLANQADFIVAMVALHHRRLPLVDMEKLLQPSLDSLETERH